MIEKKIKVNNLEVVYQEGGEGKPVIVLHGWGASSASWSKTQKHLAKEGFKVFIPDLPGFGKSDPPPLAWGVGDYADFIFRFTEKLRLDRFFIIGHSFGGRISLKLAGRYPERILGLVVCSTPAVTRPKKRFLFLVLAKMGKLFFAFPFLKALAKPSRKLLYFFARERDYYQAGGVMRETMRKVISENLAPELAKIKMSVLIVWGEKDRVIPPEEGRALAKKIKRAELKVVPGAGHKLPYEKPARFTRLVAEFFKDKS